MQGYAVPPSPSVDNCASVSTFVYLSISTFSNDDKLGLLYTWKTGVPEVRMDSTNNSGYTVTCKHVFCKRLFRFSIFIHFCHKIGLNLRTFFAHFFMAEKQTLQTFLLFWCMPCVPGVDFLKFNLGWISIASKNLINWFKDI